LSGWGYVKCQRAEQLGSWVCEDCGKPLTRRTAIGHHVINRQNGGKSTLSNCRIRCSSCESKDPHPKVRRGKVGSNSYKKRQKATIRQPVATQERLPRGPENLGRILFLLEWNPDTHQLAVCRQLQELPESDVSLRLERIERLLFPGTT
jgi:hypothetical protein